MTTFHLTVVTPDGCAFEGQAERVVCRAIDGDLAILAKHGDYCTALGMGEAPVAAVYAKARELGIQMVVESETCKPSGMEEARICIEYLHTLEK